MEYIFDSETVGVVKVGDNAVRFVYSAGVVESLDETDEFVLEWLRGRGLCRYVDPVVEA